MIEPEKNQKRLRIISGTVEQVEYELNQLLDEYIATVWNFVAGSDCVICSVVLIAISEVRKAQLMQQRPMGRPV